jgi:DNA modification methylase
MNEIINNDAKEALSHLPDNSIDCCVTSPPYYGLRDYGDTRQIGLETTPEGYIQKLVDVFDEVFRVLKSDGTLWLNIADSYNGSGKGAVADIEDASRYKQGTNKGTLSKDTIVKQINGCKPKDLIGIPWMLAFALRSHGWYLRQDIIWSKPNPMPESVKDRCTKSHEYIFLLSKSRSYYFNYEAIMEEAAYDGRKDTRMKGSHKYSQGVTGLRPQTFMARGHERWVMKNGEYMTFGP